MSHAQLRAILFATASALSLGTASVAAQEEDPFADYRHAFMEALKNHLGGAYAILSGSVAFDDHLDIHARALADQTAKILELFPEGSIGEDTRALPVIWEDWAEFETRAKEAAEASQAFLAAVEADAPPAELVARFKTLGGGCKGCHETFRAEEE